MTGTNATSALLKGKPETKSLGNIHIKWNYVNLPDECDIVIVSAKVYLNDNLIYLGEDVVPEDALNILLTRLGYTVTSEVEVINIGGEE